MSDQSSVEFALKYTIDGKSISPSAGLTFSKFAEFNRDVQEFVLGSEPKAILNEIQVQIAEGSYLLRVIVPSGLLLSLYADAGRLAQETNLSGLDRKRADVVARWQERARKEPSLSYLVRSPKHTFNDIMICNTSEFIAKESIHWIDVERYLVGRITEWGGTENTNVHLQLRNSKVRVCIEARPEQIESQKDNLVFHRAIVHVKAKENLKTGELRNYQLLDLREYKPKIEESLLQQLFKKGAQAWSGVSDANEWVENLRGGAHG
jgi:hypothetical protein